MITSNVFIHKLLVSDLKKGSRIIQQVTVNSDSQFFYKKTNITVCELINRAHSVINE